MNPELAERVKAIAVSAPPRTPERRAAAAAWVALTTTKTVASAIRSLNTFCNPDARRAAAALIGWLEQGDMAA